MSREHGSQNQPPGISTTLNKKQNMVHKWVNFSKFFQIWAETEKIWEEQGNFGQNFTLDWADWGI